MHYFSHHTLQFYRICNPRRSVAEPELRCAYTPPTSILSAANI